MINWFEAGVQLADEEAGGSLSSAEMAEEIILTAVGYLRQKSNICDGIDLESIIGEILVKHGVE